MNITNLIIILILLAVVVITGILIVRQMSGGGGGSSPPPHPPAPPAPDCKDKKPLGRLADPKEFYTLDSSDGITGRTIEGDLLVNGVVKEPGFKNASDLQNHLLTYAHGHEYYNPQPSSPGFLKGKNWDEHANGFAPSLSRCGPQKSDDQVLVFEDGATACLDGDMSYVGLVVRRGATVLVRGNASLRVQFLLIESGGLFQVGSSYDDRYRFMGKFTLTLTHPDEGYGEMGCTASQYSYQVYAPGVFVTLDDQHQPVKSDFAPYTNTYNMWNNMFMAKSIGVGFNGNYHLAGSLGPALPYEGTWNAWDNTNSPIFSNDDRLSYNVQWLPAAYPATWLPLQPGQYSAGSNTVKVSLPSGTPPDALSWWVGKQVVVLACPEQFTTFTTKPPNSDGILPIWVNNSDTQQQDANKNANEQFLKTRGNPPPSIGYPGTVPGVEVMKVTSVGSDGTLTFEGSFIYDHSASRTHLNRTFGNGIKDIHVDTVPHVALLTRNIVITSQLGPGGNRCNMTKDDYSSIPKGKIKGPKGTVWCNNLGSRNSSGQEIFDSCYKNPPTNPKIFCGEETPGKGSELKGHWLWGTAGMTGCNTIFGGQHMFRNGCAINIDGAEIVRMGAPGNFGTIAQYALHFHLCGFAKAFTGYLPPTKSSKKYPRDLRVANCSIWLALSRWIVLHGTSEAEISNNVGFMTFGSGYFVEDGPEYLNIFDHNIGAYAVPAVQSDYLNTSPIYPNVATDFGQMGVFWFKNNANVVARNVACCSPGATIGFWMVPQLISALRGIATLCIGSEPLGLPGFGSLENATSCIFNKGLSPLGNCNIHGDIVSVAGGKGNDNTPCWVPKDFVFPLARVKDNRCIANSSDNTSIPWMGFMENVNYCTFMLIGEMPEMIEASSLRYNLDNAGGIGLGAQIQGNKPRAQWMPTNGQTACTDGDVGIYCEPQWTVDLPYQPLTDDDIKKADLSTVSEDHQSRSIPKVISGALSFCTSGHQGLWGGTAWAKQMAVWMINCAFIDPAADSSSPVPLANAQGSGQVSESTSLSTVFIQTCMSADRIYNKMYPVFHNFISNGTISIPPSPTLWLGDKTFISKTALIFSPTEEGLTAKTSVQKYFCDFGDTLSIEDVFPNPLPISPGAKKYNLSIYIYDIKKSRLGTVNWSTGIWQPTVDQAYPPGGNQVKFPFVCFDGRLRSPSDGQQEEFAADFNLEDVTSNLVLKHFYTPAAKAIGNTICAGIYKIPPNLSAQAWP